MYWHLFRDVVAYYTVCVCVCVCVCGGGGGGRVRQAGGMHCWFVDMYCMSD